MNTESNAGRTAGLRLVRNTVERAIPTQPEFCWSKPALAGAVVSLLSTVLWMGVVAVSDVGPELQFGGPSPQAESIGVLFVHAIGSVLLAPLIETWILVWLIGLARRGEFNLYRVTTVLAVLVAVLHAPFRDSFAPIPSLVIAFAFFGFYIVMRTSSTTRVVVVLEAWLAHASYNAVAVLLAAMLTSSWS